MKAPKYEVGDWVVLLLPSDFPEIPIVRILEIHQQKCEAGTEQISYVARMWIKGANHTTVTKPILFREMELGRKIEKQPAL